MIITVITATYNRANLLRRLHQSLVEQHSSDIEWIIVDDGGTDNTEEAVEELRKSAAFEIRFVRKENSGKDATVNIGLNMATGNLVAIIDDDDYFLPNMFGRIADDFSAIAADESVAGLSYLTTDASGKVWGRKFPRDRMISDHFGCRINRKIWGDKCEFTKGEVLKDDRIRFLETTTKGGFGADTLFLASIAERYKTCYINTAVLVKNHYETGIAVNWRKKALQNPELAMAYYACYLDSRVRLNVRLRYMVAYVAIARFAGYSIDETALRAPWNRLLFYLAYFPGAWVGKRWKRYEERGFPLSTHWLRPGN